MHKVIRRFGFPLYDGLHELMIPEDYEVLAVYSDQYGMAMDVITDETAGHRPAYFYTAAANVPLPMWCRWSTHIGFSCGRHVFEHGQVKPESQ